MRTFKSGTSETRNLIDYRWPSLAPVSIERGEGNRDGGSGGGNGGNSGSDEPFMTPGGGLRFGDLLDHAMQRGTIFVLR